MNNNQDFGKLGEDLAVNYLINKGYQILERNWRSGHKEIDIIALDGDTLVAVEVRVGTVRQAFQSHNRQVTAAQRRFLSDWCEAVGYRMPLGGRMRALGA